MPSVFVLIVAYCSISFHFLPSFTAFAYLFIHQWRLQLLSLFSYCEQCCHDHGCTNISLRYCFKYFSVYIQKWNCLDYFYDNFFWGSIILFSLIVISFYVLINSAQVFIVSPHPHQCLLFSVFVLIATILLGVW